MFSEIFKNIISDTPFSVFLQSRLITRHCTKSCQNRWPRQHSNQIGYPWTGIEEILAFYARMTSKPTSNVAGCSLIQLTGVRSTHGQGKVKPLSQSAQSYVSEQTGAPLFGGCHEMMGVQSLDEIIWLSSFDFLEVRLAVLRHDLSNTIATKRSKCIQGYSSFSSF